jgi:hypothetical protein
MDVLFNIMKLWRAKLMLYMAELVEVQRYQYHAVIGSKVHFL